MKKFIPISLFLLLGYSFVGYFIQLNIMLVVHRQQMIRVTASETIVLRTAEFKKLLSDNPGIYEEKEFRYKNQQYDLSEIVRKGELVYIHCLNDKAEENLIAKLDEGYNKNLPGSQDNKENTWSKILLKDYFCFTHPATPLFPAEITITYNNSTAALPQFTAKVSCPPPRVILS